VKPHVLAAGKEAGIEVEVVDVDLQQDRAGYFGITGLPTIILMAGKNDAVPMVRHSGALTKHDVLSMLKGYRAQEEIGG
jgi:hypothetical protein